MYSLGTHSYKHIVDESRLMAAKEYSVVKPYPVCKEFSDVAKVSWKRMTYYLLPMLKKPFCCINILEMNYYNISYILICALFYNMYIYEYDNEE